MGVLYFHIRKKRIEVVLFHIRKGYFNNARDLSTGLILNSYLYDRVSTYGY